MKSSLFHFKDNNWNCVYGDEGISQYDVILCFGSTDLLENEDLLADIAKKFPQAETVYCSTAGEIAAKEVFTDTLVVIAMKFNNTPIVTKSVNISQFENSEIAGVELIKQLPNEDLSYVLVLSDGNLVNGSQLVKGINSLYQGKFPVTGGLAGDNGHFKYTLVGLNKKPQEGEIVAVGFYGQSLLVTHGSQGGWDMFGLEKEITYSENNVLYEIDGKNALDIYKRYLGSDAENLPASALLFPLAVTEPGKDFPIVRTILSIDENNKTMTFAGDVPVGSKVKFMKANFDRVIAAASTAAFNSLMGDIQKPELVLLVSCVGRKLVLDYRIDEEVEAVHEIYGNLTNIAGFYSYGEISPFNQGGGCQLHNQTMTVTCFYELP